MSGRMLGRRGALAALAGIAPALARAQAAPTPAPDPAQTPQTTTPQTPTPQTITLPTPQAAPAVPPPSPPRPAGPAAPIDPAKAYYLFFDQTIDVNSMHALRRQLATLVEAGVSQITLVINSPGGLVSQVLITYSFIRSLPATINTHAVGLVASAGNVLFLAGEHRSADRSARFLFHPSTVSLLGTLNGSQLKEKVTQDEAIEGMLTQIYRDRTALTDEDIQRFGRGEVIYTAEQAQHLGIAQDVADLKLPGGQAARILFLD